MDQRFIDVLTPYLRFHNGEPIRPESDLRTLGLDSMQAIEVLFAIEDTFGVALPEDAMNETTFATAGNLWNEVQAALPSQDSGTGDAPVSAA
ncbi:acyl carrier protein [Streptomyces sp. MC1]|uniref:acyl carrier protein n=1 Tax=Streptomyces sp. MC1 TaxID=295105 RepID=UPI0018CA396B|nr:acyl carrier protein [Streptomyces sp. MC1]MBG7704681.1 acyl carrier protein [Streptomyces sp. MC1]